MEADPRLVEQLRGIFASDPQSLSDPFPIWNRMREEAPVIDLGDAAVAGRHADVSAALKDERFLSNTKGSGSQYEAVRARLAGKERDALDDVTEFERNYVSRSNGEAHARLRRIAQRVFTPVRLAKLKDRVRWHTSSLLEGIEPGQSFDLKPLAYRLPLRVIGDMLDIPDADLEMIHVWSDAIGKNRGGTNTPALMAAHEALREFRAYTLKMTEEIRKRGPRPEADESIVGLLMGAEQDERLSAVELTAMFVILLFAGHETTTNLVASGVHQLLKHQQWKLLCEDEKRIPPAVEEIVRFVAPVQFAGRVASEDLSLGGTTVKAGTTIFMILAAANRDPSVFERPEEMDILRPDARRHVGFGYGPHLCIGFQLARLEAVIALEELTRRFPDLSLEPSNLKWGGHAMLRGLVELPVSAGRRQAA